MMFAHNSEEVIESDEYGEAVFDAEVMYPEVDNLFTLKPSTLNMCTQSVQLNVGLRNKSVMHTAEQSMCNSVNKNAVTHSHLLRSKNVR